MGYFSNLALKIDEDRNGYDENYERYRLLGRIQELEYRRDELLRSYQDGFDWSYIPDLELRFVLPEDIKSIRAVTRAIVLAKEELEDNGGLVVFEGEDLNQDIVAVIKAKLGIGGADTSDVIEGQSRFRINPDRTLSIAA